MSEIDAKQEPEFTKTFGPDPNWETEITNFSVTEPETGHKYTKKDDHSFNLKTRTSKVTNTLTISGHQRKHNDKIASTINTISVTLDNQDYQGIPPPIRTATLPPPTEAITVTGDFPLR